ncbi:MAG: beta-ketoacyl synthase [Bacteroidetes bacterium SW_11_45_7]|nr:MAG: beta-ketoacyl synthase [Bacteroidetes bacterium SW_11_45_7]
MNRVVITGMGIYSCLGTNLDEVRDSLYDGKSGIGVEEERKPNLKGMLKRRMRVGLGEEGQYAYLATSQALEQAGINREYLDQNEVGILYGNDSTAKGVVDSVDVIREKKDTTLAGSGSIFKSMNSTITMNLATIFKLKGLNFTISGACASGSHSIGMGYVMIKNGFQDTIICGGGQEVNMIGMCSFDGLSAFSLKEDEPTKASRPFDQDRDGLVPSGGAATVILESLSSAQKRGAPILGEIIGYGFSSNGAHISQPSVEGPRRSLAMSVEDAGIRADEIDYINAHATSTPIGDASEAKAIDDVFGDAKPYVTSTKAMTGHECWMAGASEIVYSTLMMNNDFISPNINFATPDEDSAKLKIAGERIETDMNIFLSNSFGFGGTNSSLVVKKWK